MRLSHPDKGGLVVGMSPDGRELYAVTEDTHTLTLGVTRSGKSRTIVLPSICFMALAGESMIAVDPKSELLQTCSKHAETEFLKIPCALYLCSSLCYYREK